MSEFTITHGDCIEVMRTMADASVDAIVTGPPAPQLDLFADKEAAA